MAALREEPPSDPGSSSDEGAPPGGSGWTGSGTPLLIGAYYERILRRAVACLSWTLDTLAKGSTRHTQTGSSVFKKFLNTYGTPELLLRLALCKVDACPFGDQEILELKADIVAGLAERRLMLQSSPRDSQDVLLDYRFIELLLSSAQDPEVAIGSFAEGVRVGPGVRLPRLPALYKAKKKWPLPEQSDPLLHMEGGETG